MGDNHATTQKWEKLARDLYPDQPDFDREPERRSPIHGFVLVDC